MKVNIISETPFVMKGQGVHTAFIDMIELLEEKDDIEVLVNGNSKCNVIHAHTYGPYYFWKGRNYKGRRILTAHVIPDSIKGSLPMWKFLLPYIRWYFKKVYSYADIVIAISPMVEEAIINLGVTSTIVKIYNPINIDKWRRSESVRKKGREMLGLSNDDVVVLGVGQLQQRKGVEDFLDIAEAIPEARFVWAGGRPFGALTEGIKRINNKIKNASKHIHFAGMFSLADMPYIYAASDIFLFPSYQENCPLAPLEAAASGMPVVFRDIDEYKLLYENEYLKANNTLQFIEITKKLIADKKFFNDGMKISETLLTQFNKDKIRKQLIDLYYSLPQKKH